MSLLPFFQWCEASALGTAIRESPWAFAAIESVHLLALAVIGGAVLLVDLRLLGLGLRNQPLSEIARDTQRWFNLSLAVMLITGIGLFSSESTKCYYSPPFWVKMWSLLFAILFSYTVKYRIVRAGADRIGPAGRRAIALVSLGLWFAVAAGGRWIGFSG